CRAPSLVPPVSPAGGGTPLTDAPATEQVDNRQENDGPQQRDQERGEAEIVLIDGANAEVLPPVAKCTKTTGLKMYQGQFWANCRRGDAEKGSAPEADVRPLLAGGGSAPHRPPEYKASC